jgi:hypothetical protein
MQLKSHFLDFQANHFMFECGLLLHNTASAAHQHQNSAPLLFQVHRKEVYIEGTLCVSIKRDVVGLPLIFVGNFLPMTPHQPNTTTIIKHA